MTDFASYIEAMIALVDRKPCQGYLIFSIFGRLLVDEIGLFSNIQPFVSRLSQRLDIPLLDLPHLNTNPVCPSAPLVPSPEEARLRALVEQYWALDYAIYEYAKSRPHEEEMRGVSFAEHLPASVKIDLSEYHPWGYHGYPFPRVQRPKLIAEKRKKRLERNQ